MATLVRKKLSTTAKGLGHRHRLQVQHLLDHHQDGTPCPWCGRPRWRDRTKNYDYIAGSTNPGNGQLQGDHSKISRSDAIAKGIPIPLPDRLLHARCNRERGDGMNDHLAASNSGTPSAANTSELLMAWPW